MPVHIIHKILLPISIPYLTECFLSNTGSMASTGRINANDDLISVMKTAVITYSK
jgi:hypothetical protein